jgi:hypothetical protein
MRPSWRPLILFASAAFFACAHDPFPEQISRKPIRMPKGGQLHCSRALAQPMLEPKRKNILSSSFRRTSQTEALERGRLRGNILLTIRHVGCTKTAQTLAFKLAKNDRSLTKRAYWYRRAGELIKMLEDKNLSRIVESLTQAAAGQPPYGSKIFLDDYQYVQLTLRREGDATYVNIHLGIRL